MKKIFSVILTITLITSLIGCEETNITTSVSTDYPAAIKVNDLIYLCPSEPTLIDIDNNAIIGYTDSYTDSFPKNNGETNFNRELEMPYVNVEDGVAVLYGNEWYICTLNE